MNLLFFLISYRAINFIKSNSNFCKIGDFGFDTNSTFFLEFSDIKSKNIVYCLFSEKEFSSYLPGKLPINHICESQSPFPELRYHIQQIPKPYKVNGSINYPGIYSQVVVNCDDSDLYPIQTTLTVYQQFKNPSSTLDTRWDGIQLAKPITVSIYSFTLSIWIIYLTFFSKSISALQILLSFVFVMYLITGVMRLLELRQLETFDYDSGLGFVREIIVCIQKVALYISILLISKGWKIIINQIPSDIKYYITLIFIFCGIQFLSAIFNNENLELAELIISAFCACLVICEIIFSINEIKRLLLSKFINSINSIEFQDGEMNKLRKKFTFLEYAVIFFVLVYVTRVVINLFIQIPYWFIETLNDSIMICFLSILMILFHKKNEFSIDYFEVGIPLMQIDTLNETETNTKMHLDSTNFNIETPHEIDDN